MQQSESPKLYVVTQLVGGYAREDAPTAKVVGAYLDAETADLVRRCAGGSAKVEEVVLDAVSPGYLKIAQELFPAQASKLLAPVSSKNKA